MSQIAAETKTGTILSVAMDSPLGTVILRLLEKAERAGNDRGHYSVEYFAEDLLARGCKTFNDYLDADKERRNKELFNKAVAKLNVPSPEDNSAMIAYATAVGNLQKRFGIGGSKVEL